MLTHVLVLAVKPQVIYDVMADIQPVVGVLHAGHFDCGGHLARWDCGGAGDQARHPHHAEYAGAGRPRHQRRGRAVDQPTRTGRRPTALLQAAGQVLWFENEASIDGVTAVSGSGPAYVFYMVEALAAAAERQGFGPEQAMQLARATVTGAAALMDAEPEMSASQLRINVTSPKGTTAAALAVLMATDGLAPLMDRAVEAARRRSEELGRG